MYQPLPEGYHDSQARRDLAVMNFLDLNLSQWRNFAREMTEPGVPQLPDGMEAHAVRVIDCLQRKVADDSDGWVASVYMQTLATLSTEGLEWFVAEVGRQSSEEG